MAAFWPVRDKGEVLSGSEWAAWMGATAILMLVAILGGFWFEAAFDLA